MSSLQDKNKNKVQDKNDGKNISSFKSVIDAKLEVDSKIA